MLPANQDISLECIALAMHNLCLCYMIVIVLDMLGQCVIFQEVIQFLATISVKYPYVEDSSTLFG